MSMKTRPLAEVRMSELQWSEVKRHLPPQLRARARGQDDAYRRFIETVLWVIQENMPWASIPAEAGPWRPIYVRYVRWAEQGHWAGVHRGLGADSVFGRALRDHVERSQIRGEWRRQRRDLGR